MKSIVCLSKIKNGRTRGGVKFCLDSLLPYYSFNEINKVLIKPNFLNSSPAKTGVTTDLRIIASLITLLKEIGIKRIFVGESSGENTEDVFKSLGVYDLKKYGVKIINFDRSEWIRVRSPTSLVLKHFYIPKVLTQCDLVISAAKMKTHLETKVTLSMKNFIGAIRKDDRKIAHRVGIEEAIVDVYSYFVKNMKLMGFVDCIYALDGYLGPTRGTPVKMDLIVAGNDLVAVDVICTQIMGYNPNKVKYTDTTLKLNLGDGKPRVIGSILRMSRESLAYPKNSFYLGSIYHSLSDSSEDSHTLKTEDVYSM
jgi:uncharacterized protein (DUF362 family)